MVKLGEVLSRTGEIVTPNPSREYSEITVKLWGKGVVERGRVSGASVNGKRFVAKAGNFIASRIDARNGAMGLVPESLDGALVTNDFPLFEPNKSRLDLAFLGWLTKTRDFVDLCLRASEGTTNRVRLKEDRFLALEIPLPPLPEQRRIVAELDALQAEVDALKRLQAETSAELDALLPAILDRAFKGECFGSGLAD
jgi:type I restriction enzyme, S subunit